MRSVFLKKTLPGTPLETSQELENRRKTFLRHSALPLLRFGRRNSTASLRQRLRAAAGIAPARESLYSSDADFIFPSVVKNGTQPISPETILRRQIRSALKKLGIAKRVGFHTFWHTLGTLLRPRGIDIKTAQELLRHANPRITMEIYQQAVSKEKRAAQKLAFSALYLNGVQLNPPEPTEGV